MRRRGFTLIELLVVMAIIAILASMLMAVLPRLIGKGEAARATAWMAKISAGLESFKEDNTHYPYANSGWTYTVTLTDGLVTDTGWRTTNESLYSNSATTSIKAYLDEPAIAYPASSVSDINNNSSSELADPWGMPFVYAFKADASGWPAAITNLKAQFQNTYILQSVGPDKSCETSFSKLTGLNQDNEWFTNKEIWE